MTITLPTDTVAFSLYAEPQPFGIFVVKATAQDATTSGPVLVDGFRGARYFGFYGTGGARIVSITVETDVDFAIGEFGIAVDPNSPPDCSAASAAPRTLWPPNHKLRTVGVTGVTDPDGDPVTVAVAAVHQDEPLNGLGDGDASPDAVRGATTDIVQLRAERSGVGDGRVYRIDFGASDDHGAACQGTVVVSVPKDPNAVASDSPIAVDAFGL